MTVRRGSPAARSGLIRPGDRLESVEGRSVANLPHRELAQILRRAGNTLRLTVVPRSSARELHMCSFCVFLRFTSFTKTVTITKTLEISVTLYTTLFCNFSKIINNNAPHLGGFCRARVVRWGVSFPPT